MKKFLSKICKKDDVSKCGIFKIVAVAGTIVAVIIGLVVLVCKKFSSKNDETDEFDDF